MASPAKKTKATSEGMFILSIDDRKKLIEVTVQMPTGEGVHARMSRKRYDEMAKTLMHMIRIIVEQERDREKKPK